MQEQVDEELAMKKNDRQTIKAVGSIVLIVALLVPILLFMAVSVFYHHHHRPQYHRKLIGNSITKDLQSTNFTDLSTSVGSKFISTSSTNIPSPILSIRSFQRCFFFCTSKIIQSQQQQHTPSRTTSSTGSLWLHWWTKLELCVRVESLQPKCEPMRWAVDRGYMLFWLSYHWTLFD